MKILFVHQGLMSFVRKDLEALQSEHEVMELRFRGLKDIPAFMKGSLWADLIFCWLGKLHAFFAVLFSKMLSKKSVVVAGGDDVAKEPDIKYGMFSYWWKKWCPLFVFRYTDLIISVSKSNYSETIKNAKANAKKVKLLYHGFNEKKWQLVNGIKKDNLVLTVGRITNETFRKKGLNLFVQSAKYLPDVPFVLVGPGLDSAINWLREIASPNVNFIGELYGEDLIRMYNRAKVYVQASIHESFGCSVAEAMLCECIPVVTRRAALPEVVGDCGFYVNELTPEAVANQIEKALASDLRQRARERIILKFSLKKRREALLAAVDEVITK